MEAAQRERTMGLLQASQFWVGFRICLVIRNDLELSSVAARVIISKRSPSLAGWKGMLIDCGCGVG